MKKEIKEIMAMDINDIIENVTLEERPVMVYKNEDDQKELWEDQGTINGVKVTFCWKFRKHVLDFHLNCPEMYPFGDFKLLYAIVLDPGEEGEDILTVPDIEAITKKWPYPEGFKP